MVSSENAGKVTTEGKFPCAVCRKGTGSNSTPANFAVVVCIEDVVILKLNWKRIASLNISNMEISKQT